jgi:NAD(P)-dependent dehydrogenase (short-subunit alcohol dehydrogenase family)
MSLLRSATTPAGAGYRNWAVPLRSKFSTSTMMPGSRGYDGALTTGPSTSSSSTPGFPPPERRDAVHASRDEAAHVLLTNAVAPIRIARVFLDRVRDGRGVVAFMSSGLGSIANKTDSYSDLYSASKAALNSLSRSFAASLGGKRVTVLAIAPGWVRTDMGGPLATLGVEESVRGIVDVLERRAGSGKHGFVDYRGRDVAW